MSKVTNDPEIYINISNHNDTDFIKITCQIDSLPLQAHYLKKIEHGESNKLESLINKIIDKNKLWRLIGENALKERGKEFVHHSLMPYEKIIPWLFKSNLTVVVSLGIIGIFFNSSGTSEILIVTSTVGYHISLCLTLYAYCLAFRERKSNFERDIYSNFTNYMLNSYTNSFIHFAG